MPLREVCAAQQEEAPATQADEHLKASAQSQLSVSSGDTGPVVCCNERELSSDVVHNSKLLKGLVEEYRGTDVVQVDVPFPPEYISAWMSSDSPSKTLLEFETVCKALQVSLSLCLNFAGAFLCM